MKTIIKEIIIKQLKENKIEPLQCIDLLRYVGTLTENKLKDISEENKRNLELQKMNVKREYRQGKITKKEAISKLKKIKDNIVKYTLMI